MKTTTRLVLLSIALCARTVAAAEDDDWDAERWEELDGRKTEPERRPMMMGTHTLPAGKLGLRFSGGVLFLNLGAHVGLHDRVDLIAESFMPYTDFGNTWLVGGGAKIRLFGHGKWAYAFKLRAYGVFYQDATEDLNWLPEGMLLWPSFMIGMNVKEGCFYGEIGPLLYAFTSSGSTASRVFQAFPMHFGGEIFITDWMHLYINVDILLSGYFSLFTLHLTGPTNLVEIGFNFIL